VPDNVRDSVLELVGRHMADAQARAEAIVAHAAIVPPPAAPAPAPYDWGAAYAEYKRALIDRHTASDEAALRQLLRGEQMGHEMPTAFLRRLQHIVTGRPNVQSDAVIREIFKKGLPSFMSLMVAALPDTTTAEQIAIMADRLCENHPSYNFVGAVETRHSAVAAAHADPVSAQNIKLIELVSRLTEQLSNVVKRLDDGDKARAAARERGRSRTRGNDDAADGGARSKSRPRAEATPEFCYYHVCYGNNAKNCKTTSTGATCTWSKRNAPAAAAAAPVTPANAVDVPSLLEALMRFGASTANNNDGASTSGN